MENKTKSMHVPLDMHKRLKIEASKRDMKLQELLLEIVENYFAEKKRK